MKKLEKLFVYAMPIAAILLVLVPENYYLMLAKAFAYQIMIGFIFLVVWLTLRRKYRFAMVGVVSIMLMNSLFADVITDDPNDMQAQGLKVAHFNVLKYSADHGPTMQRALETDADILSFQEVDGSWADTLLEHLPNKYPYYKVIPQEGSYGLAIFSKHPMTDVQEMYVDYVPNIVGRIEYGGQQISFVASHTAAPIGQHRYKHRNKHIAAIAHYLKRVEGPTLVIGDFNTVPWDDNILKFKSDTNLQDSRKSLAATYPRYFSPARIPIDYIFHSEEMKCLGFSTVPGTSSDHLGIIGVYQFQEGGAS